MCFCAARIQVKELHAAARLKFKNLEWGRRKEGTKEQDLPQISNILNFEIYRSDERKQPQEPITTIHHGFPTRGHHIYGTHHACPREQGQQPVEFLWDFSRVANAQPSRGASGDGVNGALALSNPPGHRSPPRRNHRLWPCVVGTKGTSELDWRLRKSKRGKCY